MQNPLRIHPERVRLIVCVEAALATAAVISFTGVIGFIGLAGPHIARILIGSDHKYMLPFAAHGRIADARCRHHRKIDSGTCHDSRRYRNFFSRRTYFY